MRLTSIYIKETSVLWVRARAACAGRWDGGLCCGAMCGFIVASVWLIAWAQWGPVGSGI